ncbi:hypothetical protein FOF52_03755 [Thermobifida alba]|uniref:Membrane protein YczE n=1 Tax=Thermobifida alba TaxID=53522 RepID=A0ABY4KXN1_THEAE|nr:hypothetical protein [Thermobifida alba]UPT20190.1 hypothetical protein FOF52_03755 [Thermobifida alba]HLU98489.1 hypothetical protein [Thermobifida alba]
MTRPTPPGGPSARWRSLVDRAFITPLLPPPRLRRLVQLCVGLYLFGLGLAAQVVTGLGVAPWDVLHQGLHLRTGWSIGTWAVVTGAAVIVLWIPLRQRAGLGTLLNVVGVGTAMDVSLLWLPVPQTLAGQVALLAAGIVAVAAGSGLYIGAGLGPGPRDGLMTGLADRGMSILAARTLIEVAVVAAGFALGGTVGVGTLLFAVAIGPLTQVFLPILRADRRAGG